MNKNETLLKWLLGCLGLAVGYFTPMTVVDSIISYTGNHDRGAAQSMLPLFLLTIVSGVCLGLFYPLIRDRPRFGWFSTAFAIAFLGYLASGVYFGAGDMYWLLLCIHLVVASVVAVGHFLANLDWQWSDEPHPGRTVDRRNSQQRKEDRRK